MSAQAKDSTQGSSVERFGLYVTTSDLGRAQVFYEQLFQKKPYVTNDRLVGFDVAGGLYAVFVGAGDGSTLVRGNATVPYIRVSDAAKEFERVRKFAKRMIDAQVIREGPLELFRFSDPDDNVIEFFSLVKS